MSILLLGKKNDAYTDDAVATMRQLFDNVHVVRLGRGDTFPEEALTWEGDWIISYLCPLVVPATLLSRAAKGAINFHPGPPEYPGTGCTNFALYNGETEYGVTCHHMAPVVDSGGIIAVRRFPVYEKDSVFTLTKRCYAHQIELFHEIIDMILKDQPLESCGLEWQRKAYTKKEFDALCELTPDMDADEMARRIRATTFKGYPGPILTLHGQRFVLQEYNTPLPLD